MLDSVPCPLPYQKAEALLYYLAVEKTVTREQAASLLWGGCDEAAARKNLRHAIYTARKALGEDCILPCGRQELIFNPELSVSLDYDRLLKDGCTDAYQGEFLSGFYVKGSPAFEEWMLAKRQHALNAYLKLLERQLSLLPAGNIEETERLFGLYLKEEPLDETIYGLMIKRYLDNGLYYKGIKLYSRLCLLLEKELSASPGKQLQSLYHRLMDALSQEQPLAEKAAEEIPGREKELRFLSQAFQTFMVGKSTSVLLTGEEGCGKTCLSEYFLRILSEQSFLVLQATCLETEQSLLLKPVSAMLLQLQHYISLYRLKAELSYLEAASRLFPLSGSIDTTVFSLLFQLFFSIGEQIPLVLFFDNLHFMDSASLDFISLLIRSRNPNILFLGTALPSCENLRAVLTPLCEENVLLHLELAPFPTVSPGNMGGKTDGKTPAASACLSLPEKLKSLTRTEQSILELLSACQSKAHLCLFEEMLRKDPMELLNALEHLKDLDLIEETSEQQTPCFLFRNHSVQKAVYEQMAPSKRCYLHRMLAAHLEQLEAPSLSDYERLIYHFCHCGSRAMELKYRILALEEYTAKNYELYPMQYPSRKTGGGNIPSFTGYCVELEDRLLSLTEQEAASIPFSRLYALLLRTKAQYCINQGEYREGLASQKKALLINSQTDRDPLMQIRCLRLVNFYRLNIWSTKDLEHSLSECLRLGKEGGYEEDYAIDCRLYGLFQAMKGDYTASLRWLKRALRLFSKYPLKSRVYTLNIAGCYNYMGEVYRKQKQFSKAIRFYQKAIETCENAHYLGNAVFYSNLGRAFLALGNKEESSAAFYLSNRLFDESAALIGRSITKGYVSILEAEKGNFDSAAGLIREAEESARLLNSPNSLGLFSLAASKLLLHWPDAFSSVLPRTASEYKNEALALLQKIPGAYEIGEP